MGHPTFLSGSGSSSSSGLWVFSFPPNAVVTRGCGVPKYVLYDSQYGMLQGYFSPLLLCVFNFCAGLNGLPSPTPTACASGIELLSIGGTAVVESLAAYEVEPCWEREKDMPQDLGSRLVAAAAAAAVAAES